MSVVSTRRPIGSVAAARDRSVSVRVLAVGIPTAAMLTAMAVMLVGLDHGMPRVCVAVVLTALAALTLLDRRGRLHSAHRAVGLLLVAAMEMPPAELSSASHAHAMGSVTLVIGAVFAALSVAVVRGLRASEASRGRLVACVAMSATMLLMLL